MDSILQQLSPHLQEAQNATDKCAKSINEYGKELKDILKELKKDNKVTNKKINKK